jgi:hypothetical protein
VYESPSVRTKLTRIEASQKGWLLIRVLSKFINVIGRFMTGAAGWKDYDAAKEELDAATEVFEQWFGRATEDVADMDGRGGEDAGR